MQYRTYIDNENVTCKLELTITRQNDMNDNKDQYQLNLFPHNQMEVVTSKYCQEKIFSMSPHGSSDDTFQARFPNIFVAYPLGLRE